MSVAVFDASVALKWLVTDDTLAPAALAARNVWQPVAPKFIQIEVANALWKYVRAGQVGLDEAVEGAAILANVMDLIADESLLGPAQRLATRLTHPVYDCLYLSLALRLSCPLITADRRLAERGTELGLAVEAITAG